MNADKWLNQIDPNLAELAALYALDILDDTELNQLAERYAKDSEFAAIVERDAETAAFMVYAIPTVPLPTSLKNRLFQRIAATPTLRLDPEELAKLKLQANWAIWEDYTPTPGAEVATLGIDEVSREFRGFVRSFGEARFPEHRHAGNEEIIVLDGKLVIGDQEYLPGDRILSQPGTQHQPKTTEGVLLFLRTSIDDEIFLD